MFRSNCQFLNDIHGIDKMIYCQIVLTVWLQSLVTKKHHSYQYLTYNNIPVSLHNTHSTSGIMYYRYLVDIVELCCNNRHIIIELIIIHLKSNNDNYENNININSTAIFTYFI